MSYDRASTLQIQNNVLDLVLKILLLGSIKNYLIATHKINSFEYWSGSSLYKYTITKLQYIDMFPFAQLVLIY